MVDGLTEAFFARAGRAHVASMSLQDFTQVLESRPELGESLQFGGLDLSAAVEKAKVYQAVTPLPWSAFCTPTPFPLFPQYLHSYNGIHCGCLCGGQE